MVGGEGDPGGAAAGELTAKLREAYDSAAPAWTDGAERVYLPLARGAGRPGGGGRPAGAGPGRWHRRDGPGGAGSRGARRGGGRRRRRNAAPLRAAVAPHRGRRPQAAVPRPQLRRRARRVLPRPPAQPRRGPARGAPGRRGDRGQLVRARLDQPGKEAVEAALRPFGYLPPAWYLRFKQETEPAAGDPEVLAAQLAAAGFGQVRIRPVTVRTGLSAPAELAAWRLGMAHVAPFISSLPARDAAAARQAAQRAVTASAAEPLTVSLLVTTAS